MKFIKQHRQLVILLLVLAAVTAAVYVTALFQPGIWYGNTFLAESADGESFLDPKGQTSLTIRRTTDGIRAVFQGEDRQREYRIATTTRMTEIFEDGRLRFRGSVQQDRDGSFRFRNERGEAVDHMDTDPGFPDPLTVYTWIMEPEHENRGNPWVLVLQGILAAVLAVDLLEQYGRREEQAQGRRSRRRSRSLRPALRWALVLALAALLPLGFLHI